MLAAAVSSERRACKVRSLAIVAVSPASPFNQLGAFGRRSEARRRSGEAVKQFCPDNWTGLVPVVGVEPTLLSEHDFESCASANSATPA